MAYTAPLEEMLFLLENVFDIKKMQKYDSFSSLDIDTINSILLEASRVSEKTLFPLNAISDQIPAKQENGEIICSPGFLEAYKELCSGGWVGMAGSTFFGGMGMPAIVTSCVNEIMNSGCVSLALNPLMTQGQIEALEHHASEEIKEIFLPKLISGEWSGTMNLTEPMAGSDVGALTSQATQLEDGSYSITGQKIYISWGDHNLSENICHLVLARLPNAPIGTKGISLFLVPKYLLDSDKKPTITNNVKTISIEKKMGLHGSPTAVLEYAGSIGWIVGNPNDGMRAMFTMMNNARLGVGIQGLSQAEVSYQQAINFAKNRKQGRSLIKDGFNTILDHADVRRNLLLMRCLTLVSRAICFETAMAIDLSKQENSEELRDRAAFLTPIAKAFSTDSGCRVAELAVQVHGGMGYIRDTGVEQFYRDVRITAIYEGTNGIQAMDLVGRKLSKNGKTAKALIKEIENTEKACAKTNSFSPEIIKKIKSARCDLYQTLDWMVNTNNLNDRFSGATPFLKAFGLVLGAHYLIKSALASQDTERCSIAKFYVNNILPESHAATQASVNGSVELYEISF